MTKEAEQQYLERLTGRGFWSGRSWPKGDSHHVFLAAAMHEVGSAKYGTAWTGLEPEKRFDWDQASTFNKQLAELSEPVKRLTDIAEWFGERGREDEWETFGRPVAGGDYVALSNSLWNVEPIWERNLKTCTVAVRNEHDTPIPHYLFISRESLDRVKATLEHADTAISAIELSAFGPYLRFAVALARKWNTDGNWKPPKHGTLVQDIQKEWKDAHGTKLTPTRAGYIAWVLKFPKPTGGTKSSDT